eukprot:10665991-Lingulodinium_polyedra.AAC.1
MLRASPFGEGGGIRRSVLLTMIEQEVCEVVDTWENLGVFVWPGAEDMKQQPKAKRRQRVAKQG